MKTKRVKYTENISVVFDKETKNTIIELATEANISQGEFVRDAVEHYINYLATEAHRKKLQEDLINKRL